MDYEKKYKALKRKYDWMGFVLETEQEYNAYLYKENARLKTEEINPLIDEIKRLKVVNEILINSLPIPA